MRNTKVQLAIGLAISAVFLYLTLRPVKMNDLWTALANLKWAWTVPFLLVTFVSMYVRAIRWHYLMRPTAILSSARLFSPMMAGFAINSLLPGRAGEFARAYILSAREKLPFTSVFATVVVERIYDMFTLLILLAAVFSSLKIDPSVHYPYDARSQVTAQQVVITVNVAAGVILFLAISMMLLLRSGVRRRLIRHFEKRKSPERGVAAVALKVLRLIDRLGPPLWMDGLWMLLVLVIAAAMWWIHGGGLDPKTVYHFGRQYDINGETLQRLAVGITKICLVMLAASLLLLWGRGRRAVQYMCERIPWAPGGLRRKVSTMIGTFAEGLSSLRDIRASAMVFVQSLLVWILVGWSMQIMAYGFEGMKMTLVEGTAITVITCIAIIIPAAPGYWGLMEIGIIFGMRILGVETNYGRALGYALVTHSLQIILVITIGLYCLWRERISFVDIARRKTSE